EIARLVSAAAQEVRLFIVGQGRLANETLLSHVPHHQAGAGGCPRGGAPTQGQGENPARCLAHQANGAPTRILIASHFSSFLLRRGAAGPSTNGCWGPFL